MKKIMILFSILLLQFFSFAENFKLICELDFDTIFDLEKT